MPMHIVRPEATVSPTSSGGTLKFPPNSVHPIRIRAELQRLAAEHKVRIKRRHFERLATSRYGTMEELRKAFSRYRVFKDLGYEGHSVK